MKLTKPEKVQFVYDLTGALFCALLMGVVCAKIVNPSRHQQIFTTSNWENYYFFVPFIFYFFFTYLFWKSSFLSKFRLNSLWILINLTSSVVTLFSVFADLTDRKLLLAELKVISFSEVMYFGIGFLLFCGLFFLITIFFAFWFWYAGFIHRIIIENRTEPIALNLKN